MFAGSFTDEPAEIAAVLQSKDDCIEKCSQTVCQILPSCYKRSRYSEGMLIGFSSASCFFALLQVALAILFVVFRKKNPVMKQHFKIFLVAFLANTIRVLWYLMAIYYYYDNFPVRLQQAMNSAALVLVYLTQSFYIQSWVRVILILSNMRGDKCVRIAFYGADSAIALVSIILIAVSMTQDDDQMYNVIQSLVSAITLLSAVMFAIIGILILVKLQPYSNFCSKAVQSFLTISILFIALSICRLIAFNWKSMTGKFLNQNLFGSLSYFVPDSITFITIGCVQFSIFWQVHPVKKYANSAYDEDRQLLQDA